MAITLEVARGLAVQNAFHHSGRKGTEPVHGPRIDGIEGHLALPALVGLLVEVNVFSQESGLTMSISMTKLELFNVYDPFLAVIKEPLPVVLVCAVFAYIVFFLLKWFLEPGKDLPASQKLATIQSPNGRSATRDAPR